MSIAVEDYELLAFSQITFETLASDSSPCSE